MPSPIRSLTLAAALVLLAVPATFSQTKGKPAPDENTGLKVGEKRRSSPSRIRRARSAR